MKSNKELDLNFIDKLQDELADMSVRMNSNFGLRLLAALEAEVLCIALVKAV